MPLKLWRWCNRGFTRVGRGWGLTQENRRKNVGGSASVSPHEAPAVLLILPAEARAPCRVYTGLPEPSGQACENTHLIHAVQTHTHTHTFALSCLFRALQHFRYSLSLFPLCVNEYSDTSMSSA